MTAAAWVCLLAVAGLLLAERSGAAATRALCKTVASLAFVAAAGLAGATGSPYGRWVLAALLLSVLGDVLLLSKRSAAFLAGLAAFLVAHALYGAAFVQAGVSGRATAVALVLAVPVGALILRCLWPHLRPGFRAPVLAYVAVILSMCALAAGHGAQLGVWIVPAAALLFALSDVAVARDRFVAPGFVNRAWGLPAYYVAQLALAASVQTG